MIRSAFSTPSRSIARMGVDDVEGEGAGQDAAGPAVAEHLGDQVGAVNAGCFRESGTDFKSVPFGEIQGVVMPRIQIGMEQGGKGAERQTPEKRLHSAIPVGVGDGDAGGGDQIQKRGRARLSILRQDKRDPVAEAGQGRRHAVAGRTQAAAHSGRKFPSEHQDVHGHSLLESTTVILTQLHPKINPSPFPDHRIKADQFGDAPGLGDTAARAVGCVTIEDLRDAADSRLA
jgi:hypothetical protein